MKLKSEDRLIILRFDLAARLPGTHTQINNLKFMRYVVWSYGILYTIFPAFFPLIGR